VFQEYEVVRLKRNIPSRNLSIGARGTILVVYDDPHLPSAYEIEFIDDDGKTLAVLTLKEEDIEKAL
jgi:hypothetical protein